MHALLLLQLLLLLKASHTIHFSCSTLTIAFGDGVAAVIAAGAIGLAVAAA
jgi:hypothetical protein